MTTWLYRVLSVDSDGDPLDFGSVEAETIDRACDGVELRLEALGLTGPHEVAFYQIQRMDLNGVAVTSFRDVFVLVPADEEPGG